MGTLRENFIKGWDAAKRPDEIGSERLTSGEVVLGIVFIVAIVIGLL